MSINPETFNALKDFLFQNSGLVISPDKTYLLDSRLGPLINDLECNNLDELVQILKTGQDNNVKKQVIEAMTTNETSFYRDRKPFDLFKDKVMPYLLEKNALSKSIKIWCAACSSGQEPYSLVMLLDEMAGRLAGWNVDIVATDLDEKIISQAQAGVYTQFEVQRGLPIQLLMKHFKQDGDQWLISDAVKSKVRFRKFNLLDSFSSMTNYDVIFCRNVLIYFDRETKSKIFEKMATSLSDHGFLFLGGAETVLGITDKFKPYKERGSAYIKPGGPHDN